MTAPADSPLGDALRKQGSRFPKAELILVLLYIALASLWIILSDRAMERWHADTEDSAELQTYKGLNFVFTTGLLLYLVLRRNFTQRRRAEEQLRQSAERFELATRAATDSIWDWNLATNRMWWSEGFQKLFGYSPVEAEATIDSWTNRFHPEDKGRTLASLHRAINSGAETWSEEFRFRRQDGNYAHVHVRGYVIRDADGTAIRMVGGISDVTQRKQAEEKLKRSRHQLRALSARIESLREEERTRIAREIHDELGQMLTGLKMDLRWIERKLSQQENNPALNPIVDKVIEAAELADATIASVQKISAELRPGVLDNLGLASAIKHEAARFQERTGIACKLELPEPPLQVSRNVATVVFRIFQETLTNVARHASATEVRVALRSDAEQVVLEVKDNGKGIRTTDLTSTQSLGLLGMKERARALAGEVRIEPGEAQGTSVILQLPRTTSHGGTSTSIIRNTDTRSIP